MAQGRICDPFDRIVDAITGVQDSSLSTYEGVGTQIWDDGPQEAQWQWFAESAGGAPNTSFGCDIIGAYINTGAYVEAVTVQVGRYEKSVIINYPCRLYAKIKAGAIGGTGVVNFCPVTMPSGNAGPKTLWTGTVDSLYDVVVQVTETPTATGDFMALRMTAAAGYFAEIGISPKDNGWVETKTYRFFGNGGPGNPTPPVGITLSDNSGNPPSSTQVPVTISVRMSNGSNPTTWTMATISVKQNGVEVSGVYRHQLSLKLSNTEDIPEFGTLAYTQFNISFGSRLTPVIDGISVDDTNLGTGVYTSFPTDDATTYWISVEFSPGTSMAFRMWQAGTDEPDDATISVEDDDGYFIPDRIDGIQFLLTPAAGAGKTYFKKFYIEGHCVLEDYLTDAEPSAPAIVQTKKVTFSAAAGTAPIVMDSACESSDNVMLAFVWTRSTSLPGPGGAWKSLGTVDNAPTSDNGFLQAWWKPAVAGETAVGTWPHSVSNPSYFTVMELEGVEQSVYATILRSDQAGVAHEVMPALSTPTGLPAIVFGSFLGAGVGGASACGTGFTPDSGWIEISDAYAFDTTQCPRGTVVYQTFAEAAASYQPGVNNTVAAVWACIGVSLQGVLG